MKNKRKLIFYIAYIIGFLLVLSGLIVGINMNQLFLAITLALLGFGIEILLAILDSRARKQLIATMGAELVAEKYKPNQKLIMIRKVIGITCSIIGIIFFALNQKLYGAISYHLSLSLLQIPYLYI